MEQQIHNFARFYAAFNKMPYTGSKEDLKKSIVLQYTWNRTDSLREMTRKEYLNCCEALEKLTGDHDLLRQRRSRTLSLMQKAGIDTSNWDNVNNFCRNPRIVGKFFYYIRLEEFSELERKLRAIISKGGVKQKKEEQPKVTACIVHLGPAGEA